MSPEKTYAAIIVLGVVLLAASFLPGPDRSDETDDGEYYEEYVAGFRRGRWAAIVVLVLGVGGLVITWLTS